jgi:WD40 repeat protein
MCRLLERLVALSLCLLISPFACAEPKGSVDLAGDPLPAQARGRLGTLRLRTHDGAFPIMQLSRDGTRAIYLGNSENVLIVDALTGAEHARIKLENFSAPFVASAVDQTDSTLAWYNSTAATVFVHDLTTGKQLQAIPQITGYQTLHLSNNGATVVMICDNGTGKPFLDAWSVKTGKKLGHIEPVNNQGVQVAVSHDGKFAATWGWYQPQNGQETEQDREIRRTVQVWDTETGKSVFKLVSNHPQVAKSEISRDGKWLLASDANSGLSLFSLETGKLVRQVVTRQGVGAILAFAPDGKTFAAGTPTGFVQVFETESGKRLEASQGPMCGLIAITFPEKGKVRAFGMDTQTIRSWELSSEKTADELTGHTGAAVAVQFLPDKKQVVTSGIDGRIMFWDAATFALVKQIDRFGPNFTRGNYMPPNPGAFSSDGKYLVTYTEQGTNAVYDTATGKVLFDIPGAGLAHIRPALAARRPLLALPYQKQIPTGGWEIWTGVWNLETGEEIRQFKMPWMDINCAAISPDGKSIACVRAAIDPNTQTWAMEVGAWNVGTGKEQFQFKLNVNAASPTGGITYSPDGRSLLIGVVNALLWIPDAATGAGHHLIPIGNDNTLGQPMAFSPDGRTFATVRQQFPPRGGVESKILIWETASHSPRMELPGHFTTISSLTFSPDGKTLASTAHDTTALLWDVTRLKGDTAPGDKLEPKELNALWNLLDDQNAEEAFRAIVRLGGSPSEALALLKEHVKPADDSGRPTKEQIINWIKQLDDDDFQIREKAGDALVGAGKLAQPEMTKALEGSLSIEARTRIQTILEKISTDAGARANLRPLRAVEALERIGTPEARDIIKKLADGKPEAALTEAAKAALERMK